MTLTGTVWAPSGPARSRRAAQDNGLTSAIAIHPNDGNVIYQGTAGGGVWRTLDGGDDLDADLRPSDRAGHRRAERDRDRPERHQHHLRRHEQARHTAGPGGLFKSTDGGASCIRARLRLSGRQHRQRDPVRQPVDQRHHRRPGELADALPGLVDRRLPLHRRRPELDARRRQQRRRPLARARHAPRRPASRILYAGITNRGVFRSNDGGQNWTQILGAGHAAVVTAVGGAPGAGFSKVVVDLAPPTSPPNAAGVQVIYVALVGTGRRRRIPSACS